MSRRPIQVTKEVHAQIKAIATSKGLNMSEAISFLIEEYRNKNGGQNVYKQEEFFNGSIVRVKDNGFVSLEDISNVKGKTYEDWINSEYAGDIKNHIGGMVDEDLFADEIVAAMFAGWLDPLVAIEAMSIFIEKECQDEK